MTKAEAAPTSLGSVIRTSLWGSGSAELEREFKSYLDQEVSWGYLLRTSLLYSALGCLELWRTHYTRPGGCCNPLPVHGRVFSCRAIAFACAYRLAAVFLLLFLGSRRISGRWAAAFIRCSPLVVYCGLLESSALLLSPEDELYQLRHYTIKTILFNLMCDTGSPAPFYQVSHACHQPCATMSSSPPHPAPTHPPVPRCCQS